MRAFLAAALFAATVPALAQSVDPVGRPVVPTGSTAESPICTDRPTRSNFACTVPQGMVQIESDVMNWTRVNLPGGQVDVITPVAPVFKLGVGPSTDVNVAWSPYIRVRGRAGGEVGTLDGVGDVVLRVKQRFTDPAKPVQFSLIPYVKAPTARTGIGNREWEGGIIAPTNISIKGGWTLTLVPQLDVLADVLDPGGRHVQYQQVVNLGKQPTPTTTLYVEFWTAQNFDPAGHIDQYSADFAVARLIGNDLQLDFGGNFGLNDNTPDAQLYLGISARF